MLPQRQTIPFESLVNTEGSKTFKFCRSDLLQFESLVNTEGSKTTEPVTVQPFTFESLVNTEGSKTGVTAAGTAVGLRVLLIQKEVKLSLC